jgi:hypothetical protein
VAAAGVIGLRLRDTGLVSTNDNHGDTMPARPLERLGEPEVVFLFKEGAGGRHRIVGIRDLDDEPRATRQPRADFTEAALSSPYHWTAGGATRPSPLDSPLRLRSNCNRFILMPCGNVRPAMAGAQDDRGADGAGPGASDQGTKGD